MDCPRCNSQMQNVIEYITDLKDFNLVRDYYCINCKSSVVETYDEGGLKRIRMDRF